MSTPNPEGQTPSDIAVREAKKFFSRNETVIFGPETLTQAFESVLNAAKSQAAPSPDLAALARAMCKIAIDSCSMDDWELLNESCKAEGTRRILTALQSAVAKEREEKEQARKAHQIQQDNYLNLYEAVVGTGTVAGPLDPIKVVRALRAENDRLKEENARLGVRAAICAAMKGGK